MLFHLGIVLHFCLFAVLTTSSTILSLFASILLSFTLFVLLVLDLLLDLLTAFALILFLLTGDFFSSLLLALGTPGSLAIIGVWVVSLEIIFWGASVVMSVAMAFSREGLV
jgi:hypothetical protein